MCTYKVWQPPRWHAQRSGQQDAMCEKVSNDASVRSLYSTDGTTIVPSDSGSYRLGNSLSVTITVGRTFIPVTDLGRDCQTVDWISGRPVGPSGEVTQPVGTGRRRGAQRGDREG